MVNQEEINNKFIEIIRFLKSEYGYTQEYIVEKAKLGKSYISKIKNGEINAGDKTIAKLCDAFEQINPDFIYGRNPYKTKREEAEAKFEQTLKEVQCIEHVPSQPNRENDLKDELIATLKSQMSDLRIQLNQEQQRVEEQKEHIATLKRENDLLRQQLAQYQTNEIIRKHPFPTGVADERRIEDSVNV